MNKHVIASSLAFYLITGSAIASPTNDTVTDQNSSGRIYQVSVGRSDYAQFSYLPGESLAECRVSTGHPRNKDMVAHLRAAELSGGWQSLRYEMISGQCWLKEIAIFMPGT
jgi:hypothetical protein